MEGAVVTPSGVRIAEIRTETGIRIEIVSDSLPDIVVVSGGQDPIHIEARRLAELGKR